LLRDGSATLQKGNCDAKCKHRRTGELQAKMMLEPKWLEPKRCKDQLITTRFGVQG
jgi:hypothetical protein